MNGFRVKLVILLVSLLVCPILARGNPVYRIKPTIRVKGDDVRFLDIFPMARKVGLCSPYSGLVIARSPMPGMWISLSGEYVKARLREVGGASCAKILSLPGTLKVFRECVKIPEAKLLGIARSFIRSCFGKSGLRCEVESLRVLPRSLTLPAGRVTHRCFPPPGNRLWGKRSFPIVFYVNGRERARVWVQCSVRVYAPVVVAKRTITAGSIIGLEDVGVEERDVTYGLRSYVASVNEVVGKRAKRFILAGSPILSSYVDSPPVIRRGKRVTIVLDTETLRITVPGIAKQDGRMGDIIKVENLTSRRIVFGRVVGSSEVRVDMN